MILVTQSHLPEQEVEPGYGGFVHLPLAGVEVDRPVVLQAELILEAPRPPGVSGLIGSLVSLSLVCGWRVPEPAHGQVGLEEHKESHESRVHGTSGNN